MRYYIFDIKSLNGEDLKDRSLIDRREILEERFDGFRSSSISLNPVMLVVDKDELKTAYEKCINGHFEGAVVKSLDSHLVFGPCSWVKIKHKDQSDFEVMSIDPVKERVEVKVKTPHGERLVGVKVSDAEKRSIHVGDMIAIEHQGILNGGGLRHPVFKGLAKEEVK